MDIVLGDFSGQLNALVFDLGNLDLVLGIDWLKTLGEVVHNWKEQSMQFKHGSHWIELKASVSPLSSPTSLKLWLAKHADNYCGELTTVQE